MGVDNEALQRLSALAYICQQVFAIQKNLPNVKREVTLHEVADLLKDAPYAEKDVVELGQKILGAKIGEFELIAGQIALICERVKDFSQIMEVCSTGLSSEELRMATSKYLNTLLRENAVDQLLEKQALNSLGWGLETVIEKLQDQAQSLGMAESVMDSLCESLRIVKEYNETAQKKSRPPITIFMGAKLFPQRAT